ncbi:MAG TPA: ester cyclase [Pirellulales bacterium]|nr:ester cyclase [Pirellulales bacterium]
MEPLSTGTSVPSYQAVLGALPTKNGTERTSHSLKRNKQVVERIWADLVNGGRLESLEELVSNDFYDHAPLPGLPADVGGLRERLRILHRAFPDFHSAITDLVAENDKIVAFVVSSGTHREEFAGVPATGRRFAIQEIQIFRIVDGKMVEHWQVADLFGMLVQLGLASSPW